MRWRICIWFGMLLISGTALSDFARLDPAFGPEVDGWVRDIVVQPDGRILIGGNFIKVNGVSKPYLARLNADGALDESFTIMPDSLGEPVSRIVIATSHIYATPLGAISSGTPRYTFAGAQDGFYPLLGTFAVDSHARLNFGAVTEWRRWQRAGRLNEDGSRDTNFWPIIDECCLNRGVKVVAVQNFDGQEKILIGGDFTQVNGTNYCPGIARLNDDGSVDTSFQARTHTPVVDIKIWQEQFYVATDWELTRHFADGTPDTNFVGISYGSQFQKIFPYSDGRVLALLGGGSGGRFVLRYNADGSLDTNLQVRIDGGLIALALQEDGGILIGGTFTNVNCLPRTYLARLIPNDTPDELPCVTVPKPEPELTTTRLRPAKMVCCWPTNYLEYTLQATKRLRPRHPEKERWVTVTNLPAIGESTVCVTNRILRWGRHYRLSR